MGCIVQGGGGFIERFNCIFRGVKGLYQAYCNILAGSFTLAKRRRYFYACENYCSNAMALFIYKTKRVISVLSFLSVLSATSVTVRWAGERL